MKCSFPQIHRNFFILNSETIDAKRQKIKFSNANLRGLPTLDAEKRGIFKNFSLTGLYYRY